MIKKPYELFNIDKINLKPLGERINDLEIKNFYTLNSKIPEFNNPELELLCKKIKEIKLKKGKFILAMGAHVIRDGVSCYIIDLMKKGFISHICFNGACVIHDFELALIGATTENVAKYIKTGEFGMWKETGYINDYIKEGLKKIYGFGQSIGYAIFNNNFKYKE